MLVVCTPEAISGKLLSCDAPVSICLCPLIRDLIYSQLSPCKTAEWGTTHDVNSVIILTSFQNMEESVAHAVGDQET